MNRFLLGTFCLTLTLINAQCPPSIAVRYKDQAKSLTSPADFSKQQAYIWLATYHAYKCECENGVDDTVKMVEMINSIVDTYAAYTGNTYGTINKVYTCRSKKNRG